jgi:hypothetical protein
LFECSDLLFRGFSATFDFIEAIDNTVTEPSTEPINILLVAPGDIRHIIYTISRRRRHRSGLRPLNFYIVEHPVEILARNLLMLEVIMDFEVPIRQRANIFLEIYGNVRVQERTARYIEQLGQNLRALVADGTSTLGLVSLEHLKYRERDVLESVFKSYLRKGDFDMRTLRDHRLRGTCVVMQSYAISFPNHVQCSTVKGTIKRDMTIEKL